MPVSSIAALCVLLLIVFAVVFRVIYWPNIRLKRISRQQFSESWLQILRERLPFYDKLAEEQQQRLQSLIKVFIHDKNFIGCNGQVIDDDIRVTIAAQACLLILNRDTSQYAELKSILVYPSTFIATRAVRDESTGLVSTSDTAMLGESWSQGKVVFAWDDVEKGVRDLHDGHNVVLHEFAHQLDHESGSTNGAPILRTRGAYRNWSKVFSKEFEELQEKAERGQSSLLDHYGATNPAEFFAVATETFFECPQQLRQNHEELYQELASFYGLLEEENYNN